MLTLEQWSFTVKMESKAACKGESLRIKHSLKKKITVLHKHVATNSRPHPALSKKKRQNKIPGVRDIDSILLDGEKASSPGPNWETHKGAC